MKIIVVYASAGSGHFKAAEAIYNYFKENAGSIEIKLIDVLEYSNFIFKGIYRFGYFLLVNYAAWLWAFFFQATSAKSLNPILRPIVLLNHRLNTFVFAKFLIKENPDVLISTHFLPAEVSAYLKKQQRITSKLITVITDFGVHPFWITDNIDMYAVPAEETKIQLLSSGVKEDAIKVLGIPIQYKFTQHFEKDYLCKKLGINKNAFTVLLVTGSFGIGPIERIVDILHKDVQLIVSCAKNKGLYNRLVRKNYTGLKVFGYVNNIEEFMAVSDLIVTKPGGLTIAEFLTLDLAPLFISAIPGQEMENARILKGYGIGEYLTGTNEIKEAVLAYKRNPDTIREVKKAIVKIKKPYAVRELFDAVCQGGSGPTR